MQALKISLTPFYLLLLVSCSKFNDTTVDIIVYEKGTSTPAVGIPVNFGYSSTGGVFSGWVVEQTKTTDANGRVSFKGKQSNESYSVGFPNGVDYFGDGIDLEQGKNGTVFLNIYPFSYVRVHVKNVNPFDNNEWIGFGGLLGGGYSFYGIIIDTTVISGPFRGTQNGGFGWVVNRNNITTSFTDELYYIGRDTIDYSINY